MKILTPFFLAALLALAVSCSGTQRVVLNPDYSGTASTSIELMDFMVEYYGELSMALTGKKQDHIFDVATIKSQLSSRPGVSGVSVRETGVNKLDISVAFSSLFSLFDSVKSGTPVFGITEAGGVTTLRFRLDRTNIGNFLSKLPDSMRKDNVLMPDPEKPLSEKEYLELLVYVLEDYGPSDLEAKLKGAKLDFSLTVPGTITKVTGCTYSGKTISVSLPLLQLLSLERPVDVSVSFVK